MYSSARDGARHPLNRGIDFLKQMDIHAGKETAGRTKHKPALIRQQVNIFNEVRPEGGIARLGDISYIQVTPQANPVAELSLNRVDFHPRVFIQAVQPGNTSIYNVFYDQ